MKDLHKEFSEKKYKKLENNIKEAKPSVIMSAKDWIEIWVPNLVNKRGSILYYSAELDTLRYATFSEFYGSSG